VRLSDDNALVQRTLTRAARDLSLKGEVSRLTFGAGGIGNQ
jgi:hypothetical protein